MEIESLKFVSADADAATFEITYSNDGIMEAVFLGAEVKSKDGMTRSPGYPPSILIPGQHMRAALRVIRPEGAEAQTTDLILLQVYQGGAPVFMKKRYTWPHAWPALPETSADRTFQELNSYSRAVQLIRANLEDEDFAALDTQVDEWNSPKQRLPNGFWKLAALPAAFNRDPQEMAWDEPLKRIQRWKQSNPRSTGAAIAEARYWMMYAWHIRGCRCKQGRQIDPVALKVFMERMRRAEQVLLDAREYAASSPLWFQTYLDIASDTRRSEDFIQKLFEEGVRKFPSYLPLYTSMAGYWAPWDGNGTDWEKLDALVNRAVAATHDTDDGDNYARIYAEISASQKIETDIMKLSLLSWQKMRSAYKGMVKRYPSMDNLNQFAAFACRAGDKETYLTLSVRIQGHVMPEMWPNNYSIDMCNHRFMQFS